MKVRTVAFSLLAAVTSAGAQSVTISIVPDEPDLISIGGVTTVTIVAEVHGAAAFAGYWFDIQTDAPAIVSGFEFLNGLGALSPLPTANGGGWESVQTANFPPALGGSSASVIELCRYTHTSDGPWVGDVLTATNPNSAAPAALVYLNAGDFAAVEVPTTIVAARMSQTPAPGAVGVMMACGVLATSRRRSRATT